MPGPSTASVTLSAPLTDHSTTRSTPGIGLTLVPCGHCGFCLMRKYEMTGPLGAADGLALFWPVLVVPLPEPVPLSEPVPAEGLGAPPMKALSPLSPLPPPLASSCLAQPAPARARTPAATSMATRVVGRLADMDGSSWNGRVSLNVRRTEEEQLPFSCRRASGLHQSRAQAASEPRLAPTPTLMQTLGGRDRVGRDRVQVGRGRLAGLHVFGRHRVDHRARAVIAAEGGHDGQDRRALHHAGPPGAVAQDPDRVAAPVGLGRLDLLGSHDGGGGD